MAPTWSSNRQTPGDSKRMDKPTNDAAKEPAQNSVKEPAKATPSAKIDMIDAEEGRTMFRYARLKGEIDADSMNYSINRISSYYGPSKVKQTENGAQPG